MNNVLEELRKPLTFEQLVEQTQCDSTVWVHDYMEDEYIHISLAYMLEGHRAIDTTDGKYIRAFEENRYFHIDQEILTRFSDD